jgi:hypothetical protein
MSANVYSHDIRQTYPQDLAMLSTRNILERCYPIFKMMDAWKSWTLLKAEGISYEAS